jgi:hypothetical protein
MHFSNPAYLSKASCSIKQHSNSVLSVHACSTTANSKQPKVHSVAYGSNIQQHGKEHHLRRVRLSPGHQPTHAQHMGGDVLVLRVAACQQPMQAHYADPPQQNDS